MAKERRDSKNRLLGKGEYQKEDGRYMYRYTDINGKPRFVYSWTLTKADRIPKGKQKGPCLRDLEVKIAQDLHEEIDTFTAKNYTVNDYFEKYLGQKKKVKETTRVLYKNTYNLYVRDRFGHRRLSTVKYSDVVQCYNDILEAHGISIATLESVDCVLKPVFKMAVRDHLLKTNPADGVLADISRDLGQNTTQRRAMTIAEQNAFLQFVDESKVYSKWKNMFTVMLGTGCRIGEICGLTWDDCDFTNNIIHIRRTLCYSADEETGKYRLIIQTPKSKAGERSIPMFNDVRDVLLKEKVRQMKFGFCVDIIDDVSGFVFCNKNNRAVVPTNVNSALKHLVNKYNKVETESAEREKRKPNLLPNISPHILRHTFCTRLCEMGVNVKVVQEVMGHSKISMTLDIYDSVTSEFMAESFRNVEGKIKIV